MGFSRKEIRDKVLDVAKQLDAQKASLVNSLIDLTVQEIQSPSWATSSGEKNHLWSFNKRNSSFTTTAGTADYILPRDVDKMSVVRQTTSDVSLKELKTEDLYDADPDPSDSTGNPEFYILSSVQGSSATITSSEKLKIKSSSSSDDGDTELLVTIQGFSGGIMQSETLTLDGTADVNGAITFDANRPIFVSKAKNTTGTIAVLGQTSGTTFLIIAPQDRNPLFKVITLYPIPDASITIYYNYYTFMRNLISDGETPPFDEKWHYAVFWGTLSKVYMHLGKETDYAFAFKIYKDSVLAMIQADRDNPNEVNALRQHDPMRLRRSGIRIRRSDEVIV